MLNSDGDIVQETEYGYTYIHGQDLDCVPAEWDDIVCAEWHRNQQPPQQLLR